MEWKEDRSIQEHHIHKKDYLLLTDNLEESIEQELMDKSRPESMPNDKINSAIEREKREKLNRTRRRIENNVLPGIPKRLQYLVHDVALLDSSGFLTAEHWPDGWAHMTNIDFTPEKENTANQAKDIYMPSTKPEGEVKLGLVLGRMLRSVESCNDSDTDRNLLTWGFIQGLMGESQERIGKEFQNLFNLNEFLKTKMKEKSEKMPENEWLESLLSEDFGSERAAIEFTRASNDNGTKQQTLWDTNEDFDIRFPLPLDDDQGKFDFLSMFEEIIQVPPDKAKKYYRLAQNIRLDYYLFKSSTYKGTNYEVVFREVWDGQGNTERDDIQSALQINMRRISKIMNDLGTEETMDRWKGRPPIVRETGSNSQAGRKWETTVYGELVGRCLFNQQGLEKVLHQIGQKMTSMPEETSDGIFEKAIGELY